MASRLSLRRYRRRSRLFFVSAYTHTSTMVGCMGLPSGRLVTLDASKANSVQSTASKIGLFCGGYIPTSRRLPIWLLSLPQLILNLSGAFTPAKNVTITSLLHQQKMRPALSFLTPHVFSLPVFPLIHAILSVTGASLLTLLFRRGYENVISHP